MSSPQLKLKPGFLRGTRVYLSGPMDFVASREEEMKHGWRTKVKQFLERLEVTVFDPWHKPEVRGLHEYGREEVDSQKDVKAQWNYQGKRGDVDRARAAEEFWQTLHIDLRMVDTADFVVAYCPTNIYSVGTAHEIVVARQQRKPVLLVSPRLPENPAGIPSLWYMPLVGGHGFFDGFGFDLFREEFAWQDAAIDLRERAMPLERPLLPFLAGLEAVPKRYHPSTGQYTDDDDWLIWDLGRKATNV